MTLKQNVAIPLPLQSPPFCQAGSPPKGGGDCTTKLYHSFTV